MAVAMNAEGKRIIGDHEDLVKTINEIEKVMGKQTIAKFVENDAILEKLQEIGIDSAQGYSIGRPQPIKEMEHAETDETRNTNAA